MLEFDLPICYLRVGLKAVQPIRLPAFAGSKLEGAFGRTLYQIACTRRDLKTCAPCPLRSVCPYAALYAPVLPGHFEVDSLEHPPVRWCSRRTWARSDKLHRAKPLNLGYASWAGLCSAYPTWWRPYARWVTTAKDTELSVSSAQRAASVVVVVGGPPAAR